MHQVSNSCFAVISEIASKSLASSRESSEISLSVLKEHETSRSYNRDGAE